MRQVVKKRITFFAIAITVYALGFNFLPEDFNYDGTLNSILPLFLASIGYFVIVPILHWFLIIKANHDKAWKIIIILSISCACARYSYPVAIADYFEFIAWLRYPIIAVLLIIEFYLIYTIIKGLWKARNLSGDPRIHVIEKFKEDDKKLSLALTFAWEPASWYYAIPRFSKNHVNNIANLSLSSANRAHWIGLALGCILLSGLSYQLLIDWSKITAIITSSLIFYALPFITANYRVARHYSLYVQDEKLVINNAFWGLMTGHLEQISEIEAGRFIAQDNKERLKLGRGDSANLRIHFLEKQTYFGSISMLPEKIDTILLNVDHPQRVIDILKNS